MLILEDAAEQPLVFLWAGPPETGDLSALLADLPFHVPSDLIRFWAATGGGVAFESEEFLPPVQRVTWVDPLLPTNEFLREQGLPESYLVFQRGVFLSAVRESDCRYVSLRDDFSEEDSFHSFEDWYRATLRAEFCSRYGLVPTA